MKSHSSVRSATWTNPRQRTLLALLWLAFLIRGFFYAAILPIWEGYDEPYHFAYIQCLIATHTTPTLTTPISRQVDASLHVLPLPWMLKAQAIPKPLYTHDDFWKLSEPERALLESKFVEIPREWGREPSLERVWNYEAQQPPLYYLLCAPFMVLLRNASLVTQIFTLRFVGVIVASLAVPLAYALVRQIIGTSSAFFSILGLAIVMPELYLNLVRVSNEVPAILLYTALLYTLVRFLETPSHALMPIASAILIGLGLLTKAYFLSSIPALFFVMTFALWRWPQYRLRLALYSFSAACLIAAVAGPWYFHIHQLTGSWSGLERETMAPHSTLKTLAHILNVNWLSGCSSIIVSHVWFGAWSFLKVGKAWYLVLGGVDLVAVLGVIVLCWRTRNASGRAIVAIPPSSLFVVICVYGFFCFGLAYDVLLTYVSLGVSSSTGWYMYCLVAAETMLLYLGLKALLPANVFRFAISLLSAGYVLLDLYGTHLLLIPYYTGLISHNGFNVLSPAKLNDLVHFGPGNLIRHLLVNKPAALTGNVLLVLWLIYVAVTIGVPVLIFRIHAAHPHCPLTLNSGNSPDLANG
jgi:hypothetical protein